MATQTSSNTTSLPKAQQGNQARGLQDAKRRQLVEKEYGIRAIEQHLATLVEELRCLENLGVTSLLASLKGNRSARIQEKREQVQDVQGRLEEAVAAVDALRREVEAGIDTAGDVSSSCGGDLVQKQDHSAVPGSAAASERPATGSGSPSSEHIRKIQRAMEACDEVRKGLLDQIEAAGSLGKCQVAAVNTLVSGALGATADHARKGLAQQVRSDLRRFLRCFAEVVEEQPTPPCPEELTVRLTLTEIEEKLDGRWFLPEWPEHGMLDLLHESLSLASMILEKRLNDAKGTSEHH